MTVSSDPEVPLLMTTVMVGGLFLLRAIAGSVYRDLKVDIVETLMYSNLLTFAALSQYHFNSDKTNQTAIAYISTTTTFIFLVGVVLIHGMLLAKVKYCQPRAVEEDIAPVLSAGHGPGHTKVTYSYVEFQNLLSETEVNKTEELQQKLIE